MTDLLLRRVIHTLGSTCSLKRSSGEYTMFSYLSWVPAPATLSNIRSRNDSCVTNNVVWQVGAPVERLVLHSLEQHQRHKK